MGNIFFCEKVIIRIATSKRTLSCFPPEAEATVTLLFPDKARTLESSLDWMALAAVGCPAALALATSAALKFKSTHSTNVNFGKEIFVIVRRTWASLS